jgi:hypothetical protein
MNPWEEKEIMITKKTQKSSRKLPKWLGLKNKVVANK